MEENKYQFAREIIFQMRACYAISDKVYLHWIDKLINDEKEVLRQPDVIKSLPKERLVTIGHEQNCTCNHCQLLDKIFGNVL